MENEPNDCFEEFAICPYCGCRFDPADEDGLIHPGPIYCPECDEGFEIDVEIRVISRKEDAE